MKRPPNARRLAVATAVGVLLLVGCDADDPGAGPGPDATPTTAAPDDAGTTTAARDDAGATTAARDDAGATTAAGEDAGATTAPGDDAGMTTAPPDGDDDELTVVLQDPEGAEVGTVTFVRAGNGTAVTAEVTGLEPGFHGFHLHETGRCDPDAADGPFMSAGGHWNPGDVAHGEHAGDLPPLFASEDGAAEMTITTDAFAFDDLTADGGRAVMVHAGPDNLAHIDDRYTSNEAQGTAGPDDTTRRTGDSGDRVACGEVSD
jgi:superoxide dismutase, Cu-Zn family